MAPVEQFTLSYERRGNGVAGVQRKIESKRTWGCAFALAGGRLGEVLISCYGNQNTLCGGSLLSKKLLFLNLGHWVEEVRADGSQV